MIHPIVSLLLLAQLSNAQTLNPGILKQGDLVFMDLNCQACELIKKTTHSQFSHVAIVDTKNGSPILIMAGEPAVSEIDFNWFMAKLKSKPQFKRIQSLNIAAKGALRARSFLGTRYDGDFKPGKDKLYCSELVYYSFLDANDQTSIFRLNFMHFTPFTAEWTQLLGHLPPENELGISPEDIFESQELRDIL